MSNTKRVLVHVAPRHSNSSVLASFSESLVDLLQCDDDGGTRTHNNQVQVSCKLVDNRLVLTTAPCKLSNEKAESHCCALLARPPFCPIKKLDENMLRSLSPSTKHRGVNVGVAILYESSDNNILLTRRAMHMRTFPNVWVPPGGHIDVNETLQEAAFRELREETGVSIEADSGMVSNVSVIGMWESVYPPYISWGLPKRHHIVVYLHVKGNKTASEMNSQISLQDDEVSCCAWICKCIARTIVESDSQFNITGQAPESCLSLYCAGCSATGMNGTALKDGATIEISHIPIEPLLSLGKEDKNERVSTGTKFALKLWLENKL